MWAPVIATSDADCKVNEPNAPAPTSNALDLATPTVLHRLKFPVSLPSVAIVAVFAQLLVV